MAGVVLIGGWVLVIKTVGLFSILSYIDKQDAFIPNMVSTIAYDQKLQRYEHYKLKTLKCQAEYAGRK